MTNDEIVNVLKEALKCIAQLTPFPVDKSESILNDAINKTADYADSVREQIQYAIFELTK